MRSLAQIIWIVAALCTARVGHTIHGSIFWAVVDFFFVPLAWLKWLLCGEVNGSVLRKAFEAFYN